MILTLRQINEALAMYKQAGLSEESLYTLQHLCDTMLRVHMPELVVADTDRTWGNSIISASDAFNQCRKGKGVDFAKVKISILPTPWASMDAQNVSEVETHTEV